MDVVAGWTLALVVACVGLLLVIIVILLNHQDKLELLARVRKMELTEPQKAEILNAIEDRNHQREIFESSATSRLKILSSVVGGMRQKLDKVFYPDPRPPTQVPKRPSDPDT